MHLNYLLAFDGIIASRGGILLIDQGDIIGAIGCSGGTDSQDEVVSKAGAAVINQLPTRIKRYRSCYRGRFLTADESGFKRLQGGEELAVKAVRIHSFGPPEVVVVEDVPMSSPGPNEVLVRVMAAGVAPWDAIIREGKSKVSPQPPLTLGSDFSGVVEKVGPALLTSRRPTKSMASPIPSSVAPRPSSPWPRQGWSPANRNR
jgi:hypothetical protein